VICDTVAAAAPGYVVAVFDIGKYVYYFFRELAIEVSDYSDKTYYSRVSRVCKVCVCCLFSKFHLLILGGKITCIT